MVTAGGICAALEGTLTAACGPGWWNNPPYLYGLHCGPGGTELHPLEPGDAITSPGLDGFAFYAEIRHGDTPRRCIWALTLDGGCYMAEKIWGTAGVASRPVDDIPEPVRLTLEWLLQQLPRRAAR